MRCGTRSLYDSGTSPALFPHFPLDSGPFSTSSADNEQPSASERCSSRRRGRYIKLPEEERKVRDDALSKFAELYLELAQLRSVHRQNKDQLDSAILQWEQQHLPSLGFESGICAACKITPSCKVSKFTDRIFIAFCESCRKLFYTQTYRLRQASEPNNIELAPSLAYDNGVSSHSSYPETDTSAEPEIPSIELSGLEKLPSFNPKTFATSGKVSHLQVLPQESQTAQDAISGLVKTFFIHPSNRKHEVELWMKTHTGLESRNCVVCRTLPGTRKYKILSSQKTSPMEKYKVPDSQKILLCNSCYGRVTNQKYKMQKKLQSESEQAELLPTIQPALAFNELDDERFEFLD